MSPSRRRVGDRKKKGSNKAVEQNGGDTGNRTLPMAMSFWNLGQSPRVLGSRAILDGGQKRLPSRRGDKECLPSPLAVMALLSVGVVPEGRRAFRRRFRRARKGEDHARKKDGGECGPVGELLGGRTPIRVVASAYGCEPCRLRSLADMFPESGSQSNYLGEFYVMDVVLNRRSAPSTTVSGCGNDICYAQSYVPEDEAPEADDKFRAVILFLPQCGVFYCSRDCHAGDAGLAGTLRAYDMSWLRLHRSESERYSPSYTFGDDGFVRRFYSETKLPCGAREVSAWKISTGHVLPGQQVRLVYRASQGADKDLPPLPPDFIGGMDFRDVPSDYRAHEYRDRLKASPSAKEGCRHYVDGSRHYDLPESCWIVDPNIHHFIDVHVTINGIPDRESVVMVRNVGKMDPRDNRQQFLSCLTERCTAIRLANGKGTARAKSSDVGGMIAIGTRIVSKKGDPPDCPVVYNKVSYAANSSVGEDVIRGLVVDLADIGSRCFPQVYSVIRDTEENSGLSPLTPMDGIALGGDGDDRDDNNDGDGDGGDGDGDDDSDSDSDGGGDGDGDGDIGVPGDDLFTTARVWADAQAALNNVRMDYLRRKIRRLLRLLERRRRVGYTVDLSCNLGNSSHFDVNDASQGYSCWTEEMLGWGENWYFVMPNVEGKRPDGTEFCGLAIKLGHGIAISWDGRVVRHCTSVSCPDGLDSGYVGVGKDSPFFVNHLYGAFTCAKGTIVRAGRAGCAANYRPILRPHPHRERVPYKKRLNRKRRQRRKERAAGAVEELTGADKPTEEVVNAKLATAIEVAAAVEPIAVGLPKLIAVESRISRGAPAGYWEPRVWVERKGEPQVEPRVQPGTGTSANGHGVDGKRKSIPSPPTAADLEIGGAYTVPRKKQAGTVQVAAAAVDLTALLSPDVWARRPQYRKKNVRNR